VQPVILAQLAPLGQPVQRDHKVFKAIREQPDLPVLRDQPDLRDLPDQLVQILPYQDQQDLPDQQARRGRQVLLVLTLLFLDRQVQPDLQVLPALPALTEPQVLLVLSDRQDQQGLVVLQELTVLPVQQAQVVLRVSMVLLVQQGLPDHPVQQVLMEQQVRQDLRVPQDLAVHQVLPVLLVWSFPLPLQSAQQFSG
jgi:hypothetical protein